MPGCHRAPVVETVPKGAALRALPELVGALAVPGYLTKGLKLMAKVRRAGVPHYRGAEDLRILGETEATGVAFTSGGKAQEIATTTVALHQGVVPEPANHPTAAL